MNLEYSKLSVQSLVAERPQFVQGRPYVLFCTISPNPKTKIMVLRNGKAEKMCYERMRQQLQYRYCIKVLEESYLPFMTNPTVVGTCELNKSGNVHFHFYVHDMYYCNDVMLKVLQRDISLTRHARDNLATPRSKDYMNNIVHLTEKINNHVNYLDKEDSFQTRNVFPNYYRDPSKNKLEVIPPASHDEEISIDDLSSMTIDSGVEEPPDIWFPDLQFL